MRRVATLACFLLALSACGGENTEAPVAVAEEAAETITLTPRFEAGESAVYEHHEVSRQAQVSPLHGVNRVITETRRFRLETEEVDEAGGAVLRLTMLRIYSEVVDNGVTVFRFDSADPGDDDSGQIQARRLLAGLVARVRVAPGGTVVTMAANLTPADLESVPRAARVHLSEEWFRGAIESVYRPLGDRSEIERDGWETSTPPGPPFEGDEHVLVSSWSVAEAGAERVVIENEGVLHTGGEADPETYRERSRRVWLRGAGRLESFEQSQRAEVLRRLAGVDAAEAAEREISLRQVNPQDRDDEEAGSGAGGR